MGKYEIKAKPLRYGLNCMLVVLIIWSGLIVILNGISITGFYILDGVGKISFLPYILVLILILLFRIFLKE